MKIFRYAVHRIGFKKTIYRGSFHARNIQHCARKMQAKIKKSVVDMKLQLFVRLWQTDKPTNKLSYQYEHRKDFKQKKRTAWQCRLIRRAKRDERPEPTQWFVHCSRHDPCSLVRLPYDVKTKTWLQRKRKQLIGPFEQEHDAQRLLDQIETKRSEQHHFVYEYRGGSYAISC